MRMNILMAVAAGAMLLSGCASTESPAEPPATTQASIAIADVLFKAGQHDQAFARLQAAGVTHPRDKSPWIRMAQLRFERGQYGDAINSAGRAIEIDPDDKLAHTIVAVSGLRVSSQALADLTVKHNISGDVRTEAQELARLMRAALGEDVLVPLRSGPAPRPEVKRPGSSGPAAKVPGRTDPVANLK